MKERINVLFTACCGWPTCGTIDSLKKSDAYDFHVVGCDCSPDPAALNYVDELYGIPRCDSPDYVPELLRICEEHSIRVLVPLISDEVDVLCDAADKFEDIGVKMLLSGSDTGLHIANDKFELMGYLIANGVNVMPESRMLYCTTIEEDLQHFGYPYKPVCVKAVAGCGSAGLRIVDDEKAKSYVLNPSRAARWNPYITKDQLIEAAATSNHPFMLQEFLPGEELSTVCLVDHGRTIYSPSHLNSSMQNATATCCELVDDEEANKIVRSVNRLLRLDGNIGYDFKRGYDGKLRLMDVNPRISATVSLAAKAGLNLVELGVLHALGKDIDETIVPEYGMKLTRNYGTLYQKDGVPRGR